MFSLRPDSDVFLDGQMNRRVTAPSIVATTPAPAPTTIRMRQPNELAHRKWKSAFCKVVRGTHIFESLMGGSPRQGMDPAQTKTPETLRSLASHHEDLTVQSVADPSALPSNRSSTCVSDQPSDPALNQLPTLIERCVLLRCRPAFLRLSSAISLSTLPSNPTSNLHRISVLQPDLSTSF
jgi:hypothetical protein